MEVKTIEDWSINIPYTLCSIFGLIASINIQNKPNEKTTTYITLLAINWVWATTYVPDDNFEAWIEINYPLANNGMVNDNYHGININSNPNFNGITINQNNNVGPI